MTIFKACDIRGIVGQEWDSGDAFQIGIGLGGLIRRTESSAICIGGDFRESTPRLKSALIDGLVRQGLHVDDLGQVPTPVVYFAARRHGSGNAAIVTASHNPAGYNGIKFVIGGHPAIPETMARLQAEMNREPAVGESPGQVQVRDVSSDYADFAIGAGRRPGRRTIPPRNRCRRDHDRWWQGRCRHNEAGSPLHRIADPASAGGGRLDGRSDDSHRASILRQAGHRVWSLTETIDPEFRQGTPSPSVDANLAALQEAVVGRHADLGIAFDGDGDRLVLVDDSGQIVRPEQLAVLFARHCFTQPTVIYDLKCASILPREITASGGLPVMQRTGHGFIKAAMLARQAQLGVEASGHHFFGMLGGSDDALFTSLVILRLIQRSGQPLRRLIAAYGWPLITPDLRIPYDGDTGQAVERIAGTCGGETTRLDGVRADYEGGWALVRRSNTEPVLTLRFEAVDDARLRQIVERFLHHEPALRRRVLQEIDGSP